MRPRDRRLLPPGPDKGVKVGRKVELGSVGATGLSRRQRGAQQARFRDTGDATCGTGSAMAGCGKRDE